jgi:survival-of-motor-neuron-related-splicing factor 30
MADNEIASPEQIAEYESQLANINELLEASPNDESLLALKRDMEELLELSRATCVTAAVGFSGDAAAVESTETPSSLDDLPLPEPPTTNNNVTDIDLAVQAGSLTGAASLPDTDGGYDHHIDNHHSISKSSKSTKIEKIQEFVLPPHLVLKDTDTEAERNKKRRAAKVLKNKWRMKKKEVESNNKQKSWQSFQKKTAGKRGPIKDDSGSSSIFSTKDTKQMTEFVARKRHKHTM